MDGGIVELNVSGVMSITEVNQRIQIVLRFTKPLSQKVEQLINQLEAFGPEQRQKTDQIESEVEALIESWNAKVRKMGGIPKGMWLVDFDCGDGYFCWKYPEPEVLHWHEYKSGFPGRISLEERERKRQLRIIDPIEDLIDQL